METSAQDQAKPTTAAPTGSVTEVARVQLLQDALRAASSLETTAHRRVRSRLQRDVAVAAIDLGMQDLATAMADRIDDWRRGEVMAIAAQAFAHAGDREAARRCLTSATETLPSADGWMRERLLTEIAVAHVTLGEIEEARRQGALVPTELTGRVESEIVAALPDGDLDRQCDAFDQAIATRSLDVVRSGIDGYFAVLARADDDVGRAGRAESAIRATLAELPPALAADTTIRLATALQARGRSDAARVLLEDAERRCQSLNLDPDSAGPLARDLAVGYVTAGDAEHARTLLRALLAAYERAPANYVDIERADYLCPIAEALRIAGDPAEATRTWMLALDAGAANPNGRPRAEDLCLTCISLARAGEIPSTAMQRRIAELQTGLKAPW